MQGDYVDHEGVDVPDHSDRNIWRRLVVGRLDGGKGTVEEGLDGEGPGGFDDHRRHALAACKS